MHFIYTTLALNTLCRKSHLTLTDTLLGGHHTIIISKLQVKEKKKKKSKAQRHKLTCPHKCRSFSQQASPLLGSTASKLWDLYVPGLLWSNKHYIIFPPYLKFKMDWIGVFLIARERVHSGNFRKYQTREYDSTSVDCSREN